MNCKLIIVTLLTVLSLSSCSKSFYYQVYETRPMSDNINVHPDGVVYSDADVEVKYNFWAENGRVDFVITNKSNDSILYIDLSRSFLVYNGWANDYYFYSTTSETIGSSVSVSASQSITTKEKVISPITLKSKNYLYGENRSVQTGTARMRSIQYSQPMIIPIPPRSMKTFGLYNLNDKLWIIDNLSIFPHKNDESQKVSFLPDNSPLKFTNFISYRCGENGKLNHISNEFYVSTVFNYLDKTVEETWTEVKCGEAYLRTRIKKHIVKPNNFYIEYEYNRCNDIDKKNREKAKKKGVEDNEADENLPLYKRLRF